MSTSRTTLAIPTDVARNFDSDITQAQLDADQFGAAPDDVDLLQSFLEDAEDEFFMETDSQIKIGRKGNKGQRETFEEVAKKLSGHKQYRRNFSHVTFDYDNRTDTLELANGSILPFDPEEGDAAYLYRGLRGEGWEDITEDRGELWDIVNYKRGELIISPELKRLIRTRNRGGIGLVNNQLERVRIAISYRYGGLGGTRRQAARGTITEELSDSQTGTVSVSGDSTFPTDDAGGGFVVLVDREYILARADPENDELELVERGVRGTQAASHDSDTRFSYTPPAIRKAVAARAAMQLVTSGRYQTWLPDTEDDITKSDLYDELETIWTTTVEALS